MLVLVQGLVLTGSLWRRLHPPGPSGPISPLQEPGCRFPILARRRLDLLEGPEFALCHGPHHPQVELVIDAPPLLGPSPHPIGESLPRNAARLSSCAGKGSLPEGHQDALFEFGIDRGRTASQFSIDPGPFSDHLRGPFFFSGSFLSGPDCPETVPLNWPPFLTSHSWSILLAPSDNLIATRHLRPLCWLVWSLLEVLSGNRPLWGSFPVEPPGALYGCSCISISGRLLQSGTAMQGGTRMGSSVRDCCSGLFDSYPLLKQVMRFADVGSVRDPECGTCSAHWRS